MLRGLDPLAFSCCSLGLAGSVTCDALLAVSEARNADQATQSALSRRLIALAARAEMHCTEQLRVRKGVGFQESSRAM